MGSRFVKGLGHDNTHTVWQWIVSYWFGKPGIYNTSHFFAEIVPLFLTELICCTSKYFYE